MPILRHVRHERFCQEFVSGAFAGNAARAYGAAGYKKVADNQHASRLRKRPEVAARIAELLDQRAAVERESAAQATAQAVTKRVITKEAVIDELACMAFANITDYLKFPDGGGVEIDLAALKQDRSRAIVQFMIFRDRDPAKPGFRIKLANKTDAIERLVRYLGLFATPGDGKSADAGTSYEQLRSDVVGLLRRVVDRDGDIRAALEPPGDGQNTKPH
jgi:hypothetical protein